jgi:predicted SAM-dependent methyltransferase
MSASPRELIVAKVIDPAVKLLPRKAKAYLVTHALQREALEAAALAVNIHAPVSADSAPNPEDLVTATATAGPVTSEIGPPSLNREALANIYIHGNGIEIGGLQNPLKVPSDAMVQYVDFKTSEELLKSYPGMSIDEIKVPDIVANGEKLTGIEDESQDFVIANHFLEHCEDPIGAIENFLRVVKRGGILFLAVPDKRFTFDVRRPLTTFEHLLKDHQDGGESSRFGHHKEAHKLILGITDEKQIRRNFQEMGHTHYHVWTQIEMLEMIVRLRRELAFDFDLEVFLNHARLEGILIIRKGAAKMSEEEELAWLSNEAELYRKRYPDFEF